MLVVTPNVSSKQAQSVRMMNGLRSWDRQAILLIGLAIGLIKTADLSLRLESIDRMMVQLRQVVQSEQGDIDDFQDDRSSDNERHHWATSVLKVPSKVLDATVAEIAKLGRIESQGVKSKDVMSQIVDMDARLKHLCQQEDLTRKIMKRSGLVGFIMRWASCNSSYQLQKLRLVRRDSTTIEIVANDTKSAYLEKVRSWGFPKNALFVTQTKISIIPIVLAIFTVGSGITNIGNFLSPEDIR